MADENEDVISLEDLVRDKPAEPPSRSDASAIKATASHAIPAVHAPQGGIDVDQLLSIEDPQFADSMRELKKQGAHGPTPSDVEIDPLDIEKLSKERDSKIKRLLTVFVRSFGFLFSHPSSIARIAVKSLPQFKSFGRSLTGSFFHFLKAVLKELKSWIVDFKRLPNKSKLTVFLALGFGVLAMLVLKTTLGGQISLKLGPQFLHSFADVADTKFTYEKNDPFEDFTDPLLHPEHVIEIEKMVVNLRASGKAENPMGLFAFYFEASNQECAIELKDREGETRDVIGRTLEQMTYEDLATIDGKEKAKVAIRKSLNAFLTRGQVRHVFFKNIVLKP